MKKGLLIIIVCLLLFCSPLSLIAGEETDIIRLHILANSDNELDQKLKLKIRDEILRQLTSLSQLESFEEVSQYLDENLILVEDLARKVIKKNNFKYPVKIALTNSCFPTRNYAQKIYPAGEYFALKIVIGEGKGTNWWCVLYPPLCFGDLPKENKGTRVEEETAIPAMSHNPEMGEGDNKKAILKSILANWQKMLKEVWTISKSP